MVGPGGFGHGDKGTAPGPRRRPSAKGSAALAKTPHSNGYRPPDTALSAAASATFTFRVTGSEFNPLNAGNSTSRLDFAATTDTSKRFLNLFDGSLGQTTQFGAGTYTYNLPNVALGTPINLLYWSSAFVEIRAGQVPQGSTFTIEANYGRTFVLEDVQLYDVNNVKLSDWTLQDDFSTDVLFDQSGRIAEILPAPIPELGSWAMWLAGLAVTASLVKRHRG